MIKLNFNITDNFKWSDFCCPCCGELFITPRFYKHIELLQAIREELGFPMNINSGHRCKKHNASLPDSAPNSQHLIFATDVSPVFNPSDSDGIFNAKVHSLWQKFDKVFDGVGRYNAFVHGDLRGSRARWDYRK